MTKQTPLDVVAAAIRDESGRYLMTLKKASSSQPLHWEFPGGKVEVGESQQTALKREIKEELNASISVLGSLTDVLGEVNGRQIRLLVWECQMQADQNIELSEHEEYRWLYPEEMDALKTGPLDSQVVGFLTQNLQGK